MTQQMVYKEIKNALLAQRRKVTASRKAATNFINEAGIRSIIVSPNAAVKPKAKKTASTNK